MYDNYNYPCGSDTPDAPWNQADTPESDFEVTCSQSLSKTVTISTNNYVPGASGVDYEPDENGDYCAVGYQDPDDTSDTDWDKEYSESGHYTPLELINMLKVRTEKELKELELLPIDSRHPYMKAAKIRRLKHIIQECDGWNEDETEFIKE